MKKVTIYSDGTLEGTTVIVAKKKLDFVQGVRYKFTKEEQATSIVYLKSKKGKLLLNKSGKPIEKQYLFRNLDTAISMEIDSLEKQFFASVDKNNFSLHFNGSLVKGVQGFVWQIESPNDIHQLEITVE